MGNLVGGGGGGNDFLSSAMGPFTTNSKGPIPFLQGSKGDSPLRQLANPMTGVAPFDPLRMLMGALGIHF